MTNENHRFNQVYLYSTNLFSNYVLIKEKMKQKHRSERANHSHRQSDRIAHLVDLKNTKLIRRISSILVRSFTFDINGTTGTIKMHLSSCMNRTSDCHDHSTWTILSDEMCRSKVQIIIDRRKFHQRTAPNELKQR